MKLSKTHKSIFIIFSLFALMVFISFANCILPKTAEATAAQTNAVPTIANTVTHGEPGVMTVENEIKTALMPVGHALYVYGGGWNEYYDQDRESRADTEANDETKTVGVPAIWDNFYQTQDSSYNPWIGGQLDFDENPPCVHWGVDCSGFIGWVLRNLTNQECGMNVKSYGPNVEGWVTYAEDMGYALQHLGYGTFTKNPKADVEDSEKDPYTPAFVPKKAENEYRPGDIYTYGFGEKGGFNYHVWMCLGKCADGSVLLVHSSNTGVYICGTVPVEDGTSMATQISNEYMKRYYIDFYNKFFPLSKLGNVDANGICHGYFRFGQFKWNDAKLKDPQGLRNLDPNMLMSSLYCETTASVESKFEGEVPQIKFNDALVEPSANVNDLVTYNRNSETDATMNINLNVLSGANLTAVVVNDVDYSNQLAGSTATITVPISDSYKIFTSTTPVPAPSESAQTGDNMAIPFIVGALILLALICAGIVIYKLIKKNKNKK